MKDKDVASHGGARERGYGVASQPEARDPAEATVTLTEGGDIDTATTAGDAARSLGLQGSGVGQLVGVRSASTLFGTGIACTTTQIKIIEWNPLDDFYLRRGEGNSCPEQCRRKPHTNQLAHTASL